MCQNENLLALAHSAAIRTDVPNTPEELDRLDAMVQERCGHLDR
jgi:hypothetical protein